MGLLAPGNEFCSVYNLAAGSAGASELLIVCLNDQHPRIVRPYVTRTHGLTHCAPDCIDLAWHIFPPSTAQY